MNSPDYSGVEPATVLKDFLQRIEHYAETYVELKENDDHELPFVKIFDQGDRFIVNRLRGTSLPSSYSIAPSRF